MNKITPQLRVNTRSDLRKALRDFQIDLQGDSADTAAEVRTRGMAIGDSLEKRRVSLLKTVKDLETRLQQVLVSRQTEETEAKRMITVIACVVLAAFAFAVVVPWLTKSGQMSIWSLVFTSAGSAALVYILFSPVQKILDISRERSYLMLLPTSVMIAIQAATSEDELSEVAKDLQKQIKDLQRPQSATT